MAVSIPIISEFDSKGIQKAINEFKSLEGAGKKAQFALKKAALPAAAALGAVGLAAKSAIAAGEAAATANARIAQINKSMGLFGDSTDKVNERLIEYANITARATGVDQNQIKATQAKLLTFGQLAKTADEAGGAFDRATKAAIDMAAAGFGEASANAVQLGKALQDPIKGITALAKSGVTFTEQEKNKIATLVESGKILEAQEMVLKAIEMQVGGTAEATANDSDKMKVAFSQVSESIGILLLPLFQQLSAILLVVADFAQRNAKAFVIFGGVIAGLAVAVLAANAAMKVYQATLLVVKAAQFALNAVMAANPITLVVLAIAALVAAFVVAYKTSETFRNFINNLFTAIKTGVMTSVDFLKSYLGTVLGFYKGIFDGIVKGVNVVLGMIGKLVGAIKSIPSLPNIGGAIGGLIGKIPGLAEGGIVTSPTLAMIGEGGEPEAVIPLSKMNGMGSVTININSAVADANLGDIIVNALKQYNRRSGPVQVQIA